ncbi:hypothetical protein Tco_1438817 [Tanacetum coccineum]
MRLQTCLTEILGFLEKFGGGFEQDIDNEGGEDRRDEDGDGGVRKCQHEAIGRRVKDTEKEARLQNFVPSCWRYGYSSVEGYLRRFSDIGAWYAIEDCAQYDKKCSNPTTAISDETIANPYAQIVRDDMVRVHVPRCMAWLDYDEYVDSLSTMDNEVLEEDPEEDPEEEPEEDVDIELEDDAELIFPYEVEGDKTPPPGDVSSDSVSSDYESEDEEVDVAPKATVGTTIQKPYAIRDFPRGLFEVGESSSARDSSHVDGLAPWALRRDLEASRAQARVMEAELVLESRENATLKNRLAETKTKLVWARMERDTAERRLNESQVWNKMFYLDMVRIGAVPKPSSDDEDTERLRKKSKNSTSDGTKGPSEPRGPPSDS